MFLHYNDAYYGFVCRRRPLPLDRRTDACAAPDSRYLDLFVVIYTGIFEWNYKVALPVDKAV